MTRWFDRTFTVGRPLTDAPVLCERLRRSADRLAAVVQGLPPAVLTYRPGGRWSMQEHAGHLFDLEELWDHRLHDFDAGAEVLHTADLQNRKTFDARHNERAIVEVIADFRRVRGALVDRIDRQSPVELARTALHPRLQQPMSVVDLCYFVAEHDDHHLDTMAGIAVSLAAAPIYALELVHDVERAVPRLLAMDDRRTTERPAPGKWSPREIVGHLIDSASNNHQRFVRATFQDDLVIVGYAQDGWVAVQRYQEAPWPDLVALWASFNRHIAHVMTSISAVVRAAPRTPHNLDRMSFKPVPADAPATLDALMEDYVRHLEHHLRQLGLGA